MLEAEENKKRRIQEKAKQDERHKKEKAENEAKLAN